MSILHVLGGAAIAVGFEKGLEWAVDKLEDNDVFSLNTSAIKSDLSSHIEAIPKDQGMLIGFISYKNSEGDKVRYGPVNLGYGSDPVAPISNLYDTNQAVNSFAADVLKNHRVSGLSPNGMEYYWASLVDGKLEIVSLDSNKLQTTAYLNRVSLASQAALVDASLGLRKIAEQDKLFNEIEDKFRDQLSSAEAQMKIQRIRAKMSSAAREFQKARKEQKRIIDKAQKVSALASINKLVGVVGSLSSASAELQALKGYHSNVVKEKAAQYNNTVNVYKTEIVNYNISVDVFPKNTDIDRSSGLY